jgi:hypothetical protein
MAVSNIELSSPDPESLHRVPARSDRVHDALWSDLGQTLANLGATSGAGVGGAVLTERIVRAAVRGDQRAGDQPVDRYPKLLGAIVELTRSGGQVGLVYAAFSMIMMAECASREAARPAPGWPRVSFS